MVTIAACGLLAMEGIANYSQRLQRAAHIGSGIVEAKEACVSAAVVVPAYSATLSETDSIALRQCCAVLGRHPIVLAAPDGLDLEGIVSECGRAGVTPLVERFPAACFTSRASYNALLLSSAFFERFLRFEYILLHQLDAFVFSDQLERFCALGYDYIGAPWAHYDDGRRAVGNGGFSLRRVRAALDVLCLHAPRVPLALQLMWRRARPLRRVSRMLWEHGVIDRLVGSGEYLPPAFFDLLCISEDTYWGQNCDKLPFYATAPYGVALSFAFEIDPPTAYQRNARALPFGCHGWPQRDRQFWRPHIKQFGHDWDAC